MNSLIHIYSRDGSVENPYIDITENIRVTQGMVFLREIPDDFTRVTVIRTDGTLLTEVDDKSRILSSEDFYVDYKLGKVYMHPSIEGLMLEFNYKGTGLVLYPASRIYLDGNNPDETLGTIVNDSVKQLNDNKLLIDTAITNAETATSNANTSANLAQTKADLAQQKADLADTATLNANTATQNANTATTNAQTATTNAESATANTNLAITNAETATLNANNQATHAQAQGDYAKTQGDYAKAEGNYASLQGDYAKAEGDKAKLETSNLTTIKTNVETAISNADTATANANTATTNANTATTNAQTATTNAETATTNANNAVNQLNHKGAYSSTTTYQPRNIVTYNGSSYMNIVSSTGILPTNLNNWQLIGSKGDKGDKGDTGQTGTSFIWKGEYSNDASYVVNDVVQYNGSSYICISNCIGIIPTDTSNWKLLAQKGVDGAGRVESVNGQVGAVVLDLKDLNNVNLEPVLESGEILIYDSVSGNWINKTSLEAGITKVEQSLINGNLKIDNVEKTVYTHPSSHPASIITQDSNNRFVSDIEKARWNDTYTKTEVDNQFSTYATGLDWKESVATFADIATTYPNPEDGWTVNTKDSDVTYRYTGVEWIAISANSIPIASSSVDGKMSKEHVLKLESIQSGAGVNQNTFSNVKVGTSTISASGETDTVELVQGTNVVLTPDTANKKVTIGLSSTVETTSGAQTKANTAETNAINFAKGFGLGSTGKVVTDCNSVIDSGFYYCQAGADNAPTSNTAFVIYASKGSNFGQIAISSTNAVYTRSYTATGWSTWSQMETTTGAQTKVDTHANKKDNPHQVTKTQVGLGNVDDVQQASKTEFDIHNTDDIRHITSVEREAWNASESNANTYTDTKVTEHTNKTYVSETPPTATMKIGDMWFVVSTSTFSIWDGTAWRELSVNNPKGTVDFSTNDARLVIPVGIDKYAT